MTLESITTSLEVSKKLEEVGIKMPTCFYWDTAYIEPSVVYGNFNLTRSLSYVRAYCFDQIWDVLPAHVEGCSLRLDRFGNGIAYDAYDRYIAADEICKLNNIADSAANLLLWLLSEERYSKENYITLDQINNKK